MGMKKHSAKKAFRACISHILVLAMFFSMASPHIAQALDAAEAERLQQQKWTDILAADLSGPDAGAPDWGGAKEAWDIK